jgi:hypothetical protein
VNRDLLLRSGFAFALLTAAACAWADPNDYIFELDYARGEREIEAKLGAASGSGNGVPAGEAAAFSWGTAASDEWFTEFYAQFANSVSGVDGGGFDSVSWENVYRFTESGRYPIDLGAMLEIERSRASDQGWHVTIGPLMQTDIDRIQLNLNLLFSRNIDATFSSPTLLQYQFQAKYRGDERLEPGMQALGDVGQWNHWAPQAQQSVRLGPAVFGRFRLGPGRAFQYNAALLIGTTRGAPDTTVRAQLEYEY